MPPSLTPPLITLQFMIYSGILSNYKLCSDQWVNDDHELKQYSTKMVGKPCVGTEVYVKYCLKTVIGSLIRKEEWYEWDFTLIQYV